MSHNFISVLIRILELFLFDKGQPFKLNKRMNKSFYFVYYENILVVLLIQFIGAVGAGN